MVVVVVACHTHCEPLLVVVAVVVMVVVAAVVVAVGRRGGRQHLLPPSFPPQPLFVVGLVCAATHCLSPPDPLPPHPSLSPPTHTLQWAGLCSATRRW
jgi:hypothetical protein